MGVSPLRIALAQANPTVGDLDGNAALVLRWTRHASERGAQLVAFPETILAGYPVEDLAFRDSFVEASRRTLERTARDLAEQGLGEIPAVVGYLDRADAAAHHPARASGPPCNAAAVLHDGGVVATYAKHHLPNYGVFDEFRYFVPGDRLPVVRVRGTDVAIAICEDLWHDGGPVDVARAAGAGLLLVLNASPYETGKRQTRHELVRRRARQAGATLAYTNMVGGQDELVFDGGSFAVDAGGSQLVGGPLFVETCVVADLDVPVAGAEGRTGRVDAHDGTTMAIDRVTLPEGPAASHASATRSVAAPEASDDTQASGTGDGDAERLGEIYAALVTATRDYADKNGFGSALLGLSGGVDSALTATVAADALGADRVHVAIMPSRHSSEHSVADARELARRRELIEHAVPIAPMVDAFEKEIELHGVAAENLQARVRGIVLMSLSNEHGHLVLAPGNKSELAVGYSTLYGDSVGGYAPLKDVPKTTVWELARWRNRVAESRGETPPIPDSSITKEPSAELRPGQRDVDSLPDYAVLDPLLDDYIERDMGRDALVAAGHDPAVVQDVLRRVDAAEYKRRQYPPGPKISLKAFGRDRRLPISNRWREPGG